MRKFSINFILEQEDAERIKRLVKFLGGTPGMFSKAWVLELSRLTPEQLRQVHAMVEAMGESNAKMSNIALHA